MRYEIKRIITNSSMKDAALIFYHNVSLLYRILNRFKINFKKKLVTKIKVDILGHPV